MEEEKQVVKVTNRNSGWKHEVYDLIKTFIICLFTIFIIGKFIVRPVQVEGVSMYPTLKDNDYGFMNVFSARFQDIKRYDVVIVYYEKNNEDWVKRVIGLPGDTIYAQDDQVYVNGEVLEEPYLNTEYVNTIRDKGVFTEDFKEITLGENEYFLMGDNRNESNDSRKVGPFAREEIRGKDVYVVYPFQDMRIVSNGGNNKNLK